MVSRAPRKTCSRCTRRLKAKGNFSRCKAEGRNGSGYRAYCKVCEVSIPRGRACRRRAYSFESLDCSRRYKLEARGSRADLCSHPRELVLVSSEPGQYPLHGRCNPCQRMVSKVAPLEAWELVPVQAIPEPKQHNGVVERDPLALEYIK